MRKWYYFLSLLWRRSHWDGNVIGVRRALYLSDKLKEF